jgi:hypothetical protein
VPPVSGKEYIGGLAYLAYEAVCNETYTPYGGAVTCIWDERHHTAAVFDGVRATHRYLLTATRPRAVPVLSGP